MYIFLFHSYNFTCIHEDLYALKKQFGKYELFLSRKGISFRVLTNNIFVKALCKKTDIILLKISKNYNNQQIKIGIDKNNSLFDLPQDEQGLSELNCFFTDMEGYYFF